MIKIQRKDANDVIVFTKDSICPFPKAVVRGEHQQPRPEPDPDSQPIACRTFERLLFFSKLLLTDGFIRNIELRWSNILVIRRSRFINLFNFIHYI